MRRSKRLMMRRTQMPSRWRPALLAAGMFLLAGCAGERPHGHHGGRPPAGPPARFDNLGS
jgi:hypothetical protein